MLLAGVRGSGGAHGRRHRPARHGEEPVRDEAARGEHCHQGRREHRGNSIYEAVGI